MTEWADLRATGEYESRNDETTKFVLIDAGCGEWDYKVRKHRLLIYRWRYWRCERNCFRLHRFRYGLRNKWSRFKCFLKHWKSQEILYGERSGLLLCFRWRCFICRRFTVFWIHTPAGFQWLLLHSSLNPSKVKAGLPRLSDLLMGNQ